MLLLFLLRYKAVTENGVVVAFFNKLTQEEYIDNASDPLRVMPHLPSGLGTQAGEEARVDAEKLYHWPWWEHSPGSTWTNQHFPTRESYYVLDPRTKRPSVS